MNQVHNLQCVHSIPVVLHLADDITQGLPRVEELFEARIPKGKATIAEITGKVTNIEENNGKQQLYYK